jgi:predicted alpha/beta hydrolase
MMSKRGIESINSFYKNAAQEHRRIAPQDVGAKRIGHFGFFRPQFRNSLWQQALEWLDAASIKAMHTQQAQPVSA